MFKMVGCTSRMLDFLVPKIAIGSSCTAGKPNFVVQAGKHLLNLNFRDYYDDGKTRIKRIKLLQVNSTVWRNGEGPSRIAAV